MRAASPRFLRETVAGLAVDSSDLRRLLAADLADPHRVLGWRRTRIEGEDRVVVRAFHPEATGAECLTLPDLAIEMEPLGEGGIFGALLSGMALPPRYRLRFRFADGNSWECDDPYRFPVPIGPVDIYLLGEGTHRKLWRVLGAHPVSVHDVDGTAFAVWAPNARRVSVVGDFNRWDGRRLPMHHMGGGVFGLFVPAVASGDSYKYEIKTRAGEVSLKSDPFASSTERRPGQSSRVFRSSYGWKDDRWVEARPGRDPHREPMAIYEVHLGSWARVPEDGDRMLGYREIAPMLVQHMTRFSFTHLELLPVAEHPFDGSWGYQVTGFYAPTSRYGDPDGFRYLVDLCHQHGIGVILDWVPGHFPRDDFALRRFDGTPLFEHDDARLGEHPHWGTLIFNYGRNEVRNFLIASALYWFEEFHVDGLRVDAVASMLYRDYGRADGDWLPNHLGGRENFEAADLLRELSEVVRLENPGCMLIAEESTAWDGVTRAAPEGGLGFTFKWNMGWMHDTLSYLSRDPVHRAFHHDDLTFASIYEQTERFVMPLSHDEVVHGKRSLLEKMPGDYWQKFANLRLLLTYQYTRPGKKLLFMGTELAPHNEWSHRHSLDWHLASDPRRVEFARFLEALGLFYRSHSSLWRSDPDPAGFSWIDCADRENSVVSYLRTDGDELLVIVLNATPVPRSDYRIGAPRPGTWAERLSSDAPEFGGSGFPTRARVEAEPVAFHGYPQSLRLELPPLGVLIFAPDG